jgi:hypothetical protein
MFPSIKASNACGKASKEIASEAIISNFWGFKSAPILCHTSSLKHLGVSTEFIPSKFTARKIKGITVVSSLKLEAKPIEAILPP